MKKYCKLCKCTLPLDAFMDRRYPAKGVVERATCIPCLERQYINKKRRRGNEGRGGYWRSEDAVSVAAALNALPVESQLLTKLWKDLGEECAKQQQQ